MKNLPARAFFLVTLFLFPLGSNPRSALAPLQGCLVLAMQAQPSSTGGQSSALPQFRLEDGTPIKLRVSRTISSADAQVDERVDFEVLEEVKLGDTLVIPKGSVAWGTVTDAQPKRRMARGGKLDVNIDSVRLADGEKAALRGTKDVKGGGHTGAMTGGIVATSLIVWPAAPFFLFMHGKDVTIPKGTEITTYINGDMNLDPAKFSAAPATPSATASGTAQHDVQHPPSSVLGADLATVLVKSTPDGADITMDGKFVGSTPSTIRLSPGDHSLVLEKTGYKAWQRTITVSPGSAISIGPTLEQSPT